MKPFLLIGLTPQGLSMLRLLSRAGFKVIAFTNTKRVVGYCSRYGEKYLFGSIEDLKYQIAGIVEKYNEKLNCIITSGELLSLILLNYVELYDLCNVQSGPYPLIKILSNKQQMYSYAQQKGLKCANYTLLSDYKDGVLKLPVILKRNIEIPLFFKIKKIQTRKELIDFMFKIKKGELQHILVQEFISLQSYKNISVQAYLFKGDVKANFICYQERRLSIGITSFLKEVDDVKIKSLIIEKTREFFNETEYTGFCELEFIYDIKLNELFFIEINTRSCGLHSAFCKKFRNLSELYLNIDNPPILESSTNLISWVNIVRDIKSRFQNKDGRSLSQFFTSKYDIWDKSDLKPFFFQFIKSINV